MAATRVQLVAPLLASLVAVSAQADDRAAAGVFVHTDDDGLTVVHPIASARAEVAPDTHVGARWEADVISAATVDVRTSASPRGFEETRHGLAFSVDRAFAPTLAGTASGAVSWSPDHQAFAGGLRAAVEDDARTHTLSASVAFAHEEVGRAGDLETIGTLDSFGGTLAWATLLSRVATFDLAIAAEHQRGYLESPYRFVPVRSSGGQDEVRVAESVPDVRNRGATRAQVRVALSDGWFGRAWYRFHLDDWGVLGHTAELSVAAEPHPRWLVTVHGRFYGQRGASFYQAQYPTMPEIPSLRTLDRELAPGFYVAGGLRVEHELGDLLGFTFRADLRGEVLRHRYFDTPALPERHAITVGLGLAAER